MKYGCICGFRSNLINEINFAKKYFDFVEITIKPNLLNHNQKYFLKIKKILGGFEVLGHVHWDIKDINKIYKNILILKSFGAKKITIHPFSKDKQNPKQNIKENIFLLLKINDFCRKNKIQLLVENMSSAPFNKVSNITKLTKKISNLGITLDTGHADRTSKNELNNFLKKGKSKIKHMHFHDTHGKLDHLFFTDVNKMKKQLAKFSSIGYDKTINLETFAIMKNKKYKSLNFSQLKKAHLKQLEKIK